MMLQHFFSLNNTKNNFHSITQSGFKKKNLKKKCDKNSKSV